MRIYLAGPMRGIAHFNFPAFHFAAAKLREQGHIVFSPADNDIEKNGDFSGNYSTGSEDQLEKDTAWTIRKALADDTAWICRNADAIALLPGWEKSTGANAELSLAKALGLTWIVLGKEFVQ